jgi:hypothetical protein
MEIRDALNACDYLSWAYYHDIALTFDFTVADVKLHMLKPITVILLVGVVSAIVSGDVPNCVTTVFLKNVAIS